MEVPWLKSRGPKDASFYMMKQLLPIPLTEPVEANLVSSDDDTPAAAGDSDEQFFPRGFDSENLDLVSDEVPIASFTISFLVVHSLPVVTATASDPPQAIMTSSTILTTTIPRTEVGSSSGSRAIKHITIEIPFDGNILKKSGQANVWLKPLISPVEKSKVESHSSLTWINDIVQSSLKINLIDTEMMESFSYGVVNA